MATSEGIPSSIDIEFLELNDNPYINHLYRNKNGVISFFLGGELAKCKDLEYAMAI